MSGLTQMNKSQEHDQSRHCCLSVCTCSLVDVPFVYLFERDAAVYQTEREHHSLLLSGFVHPYQSQCYQGHEEKGTK